jgi:hypothetical protein
MKKGLSALIGRHATTKTIRDCAPAIDGRMGQCLAASSQDCGTESLGQAGA